MINNFTPFPELKTERIILKKLEDCHIQALYDYQSNKANFKYVDMPVYTSIDEAKDYVAKMNDGVEKNKFIIWAICLQENEEIIGTISIWNLNKQNDTAELGYGIFPDYRRLGYMKESLTAVLGYGFNQMQLKTIEAYTSYYNEPSNKFLRNMQFSYVKTIEDEYLNGALMNIYKLINV